MRQPLFVHAAVMCTAPIFNNGWTLNRPRNKRGSLCACRGQDWSSPPHIWSITLSHSQLVYCSTDHKLLAKVQNLMYTWNTFFYKYGFCILKWFCQGCFSLAIWCYKSSCNKKMNTCQRQNDAALNITTQHYATTTNSYSYQEYFGRNWRRIVPLQIVLVSTD